MVEPGIPPGGTEGMPSRAAKGVVTLLQLPHADVHDPFSARITTVLLITRI